MESYPRSAKFDIALFTTINHACYSKFKSGKKLTPFILFQKNEETKFVNIYTEGDPNLIFWDKLIETGTDYDIVVFCYEGTVPFDRKYKNAFIIRAFDTSRELGFMMYQLFHYNKYYGTLNLKKSMNHVPGPEMLPFPVRERDSNKCYDAPNITIYNEREDGGLVSKVVEIGHPDPNVLCKYIFETGVKLLLHKEKDFSGHIHFKIIKEISTLNEYSKYYMMKTKISKPNNKILHNL